MQLSARSTAFALISLLVTQAVAQCPGQGDDTSETAQVCRYLTSAGENLFCLASSCPTVVTIGGKSGRTQGTLCDKPNSHGKCPNF
ncbi:hypothetical protein CMUS01_13948 [Colletotrichum musicola]|uniref:Uncharacterized protein n=1 Tax=Colletotrichum musicola TaxID=2175873 RepID=A0A8H6J861_9PEZI|nr:hypothetical protein CMUS01_13948 [Colletotrichum musicola]